MSDDFISKSLFWSKNQIFCPPKYKPTFWQIILFFFAPISVIFCISLLAVDIPFYDQWRFIQLIHLAKTNKLTIIDLWAQHNEHRCIFPKLIMLIFAHWTHWNIRVEIFANIILAVVTLLVLCKAATKQFSEVGKSAKPLKPYTLYTAFSVLIFSLAQVENWMWGWQMTVFMNILCTISGFYVLCLTPFNRNLSWLVAFACGVIATYSFANGLLYWFISFGVLLVSFIKNRHWSILHIISWSIGTVAILYSYFYDFKSIGHHPPLAYALKHPHKFIIYFNTYLGTSIFRFLLHPVNEVQILIIFLIGSAGLAVGLTFLIRYWHKLGLNSTTFLFWNCLFIYALLSDFVTASARCGFGLLQATSSRYVTISNLYWIWLVVVLYFLIRQNLLRLSNKILFSFFLSVFCLC
ncbi:hypothetical protein BN8_06366 [Fibrisoma limi BUZ 3]|uniref:Transmembrane protein n=1 Tax=Fibrisoma limi BUZ 3 TaxID=1185876 RepID=I2GSU6_9BACT|nr:hypothetical protein [Fibrisoma limi]CCH56975.1 hypothetical protein BN8_06366 [Fibrisoma limi BUZ 3]